MVSSSHHEKGFCASKFHKVYFLSILPLFYFCLFCGSSIIFAVLYKHRKDTLFLLQMTYDFCHRALSNWKSALKVEKKILLGVLWINPIFHHSHSSILVFGHSFSPHGPPSRQIIYMYIVRQKPIWSRGSVKEPIIAISEAKQTSWSARKKWAATSLSVAFGASFLA